MDKELLTTFIPLSTGDFLFTNTSSGLALHPFVSSRTISICKQGALGTLLDSVSSTTEEKMWNNRSRAF
jgi:hypothetical protein